jgi:phytoene dehydrogenase-like protein
LIGKGLMSKTFSRVKKGIIIGGGHNGLVAACYLAKAGHQITVLEARDIVGGAAVTEEFHPGFRNSTASYTVSLLHPTVMSDLNLESHGLEIIERPVSNFLPLPNGEFLALYPALFEIRKHCLDTMMTWKLLCRW